MKLLRIIIKPYIIIPLLGLLIWYWIHSSYSGLYQQQPELLTYPVKRADVTQSVMATGILKATKNVDVGAQISGQLKKIHVKVGDRIREGQLLAEVDSTIMENTLSQSESDIKILLARQDSARIKLNQAKRNLARFKEISLQKTISVQAFEELETTYLLAKHDLAQANEELHKAQIEISNARKNLSFAKINAPLSGTVVEIVTQEGQTIISSQVAPTIMRVADLSNMTVEALISEVDILKVHKNDKAYFSIFGEPSVIYKTKLDLIKPSPENRNNSIFYKAQLQVPNTDEKLRLDMTANVTIIQAQAKNVLTVSRELIRGEIPKKAINVRVLNANSEQINRTIKFGLADRYYIEIVSGLEEGEAIIPDKQFYQDVEAAITR